MAEELLDNLEQILEDVRLVLLSADRFRYSSDENVISETRSQMEAAILIIAEATALLDNRRVIPDDISDNIKEGFEELLDQANEYLTLYTSKADQFVSATEEERDRFSCPTENSGRRGRPRFLVDEEHVLNLKSLGFNWKKIASILGVSRSTLDRARSGFRRQETNFSNISDLELDALVKEIVDTKSDIGERMLYGN